MPTLTITNSTARPSLPNTEKIVLDGANPVINRTCPTIASLAQTSPTFYSDYKITATNPTAANDTYTNISQFLTSFPQTLEGTVTVTNPPSTTNDNDQIVGVYLPYLENTYLPTVRYVRQCLEESSTPNYDSLLLQKGITAESKDRLDSIKTPEQRVSYYEGWFPLIRPISEAGLFALFGVGLLFMILALGVFLRLGGIEFHITLPTVFVNTGYGGESGYMKYVYIGAVVGSIIGVVLYGYYKLNWFGGPKKDGMKG